MCEEEREPLFSPQEQDFDRMAYNVLTYLDSQEEIREIEFSSGDSLKSIDISSWERRFGPYMLPPDVKAFLGMFNGVLVRWKVEVDGRHITIGEIAVNSIDRITEVAIEGRFHPARTGGLAVNPPDSMYGAFIIASNEFGDVVLFVLKSISETSIKPIPSNSGRSSTMIYFKDKKSQLHYICSTFTQYLRLAVLHLGVLGWHEAYTPEGLSLVTKQWMGLFCKERLCVDLHAHEIKEG